MNSVERIHEFCWIVSGLFNFSLVEKERLWNTNCLVERILLLNGFLLKFNDIKNVTTIFDIDAPGHSVNSNVYVFAVLFVILLLKYLDLI